MNPNGVSWSVAMEGMTCSNPSHVPGCPCQAGGDAELRYGLCFICKKRECDETSVNYDFGLFGIAPVCGICQDTADELMDDEDEDEPDLNVEGWPEFNGSFR